jgi:hypothetical protein
MKANGTMTKAGFIPYYFHAELDCYCPVKIDQPIKIHEETGRPIAVNPKADHMPKRNENGDLIYALPGGGEFALPRKPINQPEEEAA